MKIDQRIHEHACPKLDNEAIKSVLKTTTEIDKVAVAKYLIQ